MSDIRLFLVDTFTNKIFHGYAAAVCVLKEELNDELLHAIAIENLYPETVFIQAIDREWHIRWFNTAGEIFSSGHGLLAAAHVLFFGLKHKGDALEFKSHMGKQQVLRRADKLFLSYPMIDVNIGQVPAHVWQNFSIEPQSIWQNGPDMLVCFAEQEQLEKVQLHLEPLKSLVAGALVMTSSCQDADAYVRCFFPRVSPWEEIATPAIYPRLCHFYEQKQQKKIALIEQGLMRRSQIYCERHQDRLWVGGECRFYFRGELLV